MNKKRIFRNSVCIGLLTGVVCFNLAYGSSLNHLFHPKIARADDSPSCDCPVLSGNKMCTANNWGNQCAPDGTAQCTTYNYNCEG